MTPAALMSAALLAYTPPAPMAPATVRRSMPALMNANADILQTLRQLEEDLGHRLFERRRTGLVLTEAGRIALDYAESIGRAGEELLDVMQHRPRGGRQVLRIGAVATLSRNFQLEFLRPALHRPDVEVVLRSGGFPELLVMLHSHQVDLVLLTFLVVEVEPRRLELLVEARLH
jgi:LysR family transcriptional activator of nhaA